MVSERNKLRIGFIGSGFVLNKCVDICKNLGFEPLIYKTCDEVDSDVLFAMRIKEIIPESIIKKVPLGIIL